MLSGRFFSLSCCSAILLFSCALSLSAARAQTPASAPPAQPSPTVVPPAERAPQAVAGDADLYCAGVIEDPYAEGSLQVVGGEQEQEQQNFTQGDYIFLSGGTAQGLRVGQEFSVVRPRGRFRSHWTHKRGSLGVYVQELGRARVTAVREQSAVALVTRSCETILFGDLLRPVAQRVSPPERPEALLDRFAQPSGRQTGRIVLARDAREMVSRNQIVFIDLGAEDGVRAGSYLTIFRPAGTGSLTGFRGDRPTPAVSSGFESERYRGGRFSLRSPRARRPAQTGILASTVSAAEVRRNRPPVPRMVLGEMVILNVQRRTATAIITRVTQEIHTGDYVELQ